jgi:hypothetical protein
LNCRWNNAKKQKDEKSLQQIATEFGEFLEIIPDGVMIVGNNHRIRTVNRQLQIPY